MITVPTTGSPQARADALSRRIIACRASATVLRCAGTVPQAALELLHEADALQAELTALRAA